MKIGFDSARYLEEQSKYILERVHNYDKLYLEFGGKLLYDMHAKRVLPGFDENAKIKLLHRLREKLEVIICVYAGDIERNKIRGDFGITYDMDVLRLIDDLRAHELHVNSVVITRYEEQPSADIFINKLERRNIKVYRHRATKGYPTDVDTIVSNEGYGQNPFITTDRPIVAVTAPGPGSGKLATCLSQLYHEFQRGTVAGYSKFETFPVWNLPLTHPVNIAYEAATVDLKDTNMIDSFHAEAYGAITVNYNRDIETFPVLRRIIEKITGQESIYKSPTDMGVNRVGFGIIDDAVVQEAARQEIIRRYFKTACDYKKGYVNQDILERMQLILEEVGMREEGRKVVGPARKKSESMKNPSLPREMHPAVAIELQDGTIVTGKSSTIMYPTAAAVLNALKNLAGIKDDMPLISPVILEPIQRLKRQMGDREPILNCEEILIALSICAPTNTLADLALSKLPQLKGTQAHCTAILSANDEKTFRSLDIEVTSDPVFASERLYYNN